MPVDVAAGGEWWVAAISTLALALLGLARVIETLVKTARRLSQRPPPSLEIDMAQDLEALLKIAQRLSQRPPPSNEKRTRRQQRQKPEAATNEHESNSVQAPGSGARSEIPRDE